MSFTNILTAALMSVLVAGTALSAEPAPRANTPKAPAASTDAMPAVNEEGKAAVSSPNRAKPTSGAKQPAARTGSDRLDLDTTVVTGNRELPKVLYIVPWKRSDLGDLPAQPLNSLLDEVLAPVDRDVFRREVTYYGAMADSDGGTKGAPESSAAGSEK
jgi:hypothetical protein